MGNIFDFISNIFSFIMGALTTASNSVKSGVCTTFDYVNELPIVLRILCYIVLSMALISAIAAYINALLIYTFSDATNDYRFEKKTSEKKLRNYFFKPGLYHISNIWKSSYDSIFTKNRFGICWAQKALGDFQPFYKTLTIPLTPIFLVLWMLSFPEFLLRIVFGIVVITTLTLLHFFAVIVPLPLLAIVVATLKIQQNGYRNSKKLSYVCPDCKLESKEPYYKCPDCGEVHKKLEPGLFGLFCTTCAHPERTSEYSRQICKARLPIYMSGKSRLTKVCPRCGNEHETGASKNFGIQLVGASSSGKTTFLTAFWHLYFERAKKYPGLKLKLNPRDRFDELEKDYQSGNSMVTSEKNAISYSVEHFFPGESASINFTIYDIAGEVFPSEDYDKIQEQYRYCDGIILVIDPLYSSVVIGDYSDKNDDDLKKRSDTNPNVVLNSFINDFKRQRHTKSFQMNAIPISVVITKADVRAVKKVIGKTRIALASKKDASPYNSFDDARNSICREYLESIDFGDIINILDSNFKNVDYYPVSAMGHNTLEVAYEPFGIEDAILKLLTGKILNIMEGKKLDGSLKENQAQYIKPRRRNG